MRAWGVGFLMHSAAAVAALFALYLLFAFSFSVHEIVLGLLFAFATAGFTALAWRASDVHFHPALRDLARGWRVPWYICSGAVTVTAVLVKDLSQVRVAGSYLRTAPFGSSSDVARTVLATTYMTISPNSIVVGIERDKHLLVFHQLEKSKVSQMVLDLGGAS